MGAVLESAGFSRQIVIRGCTLVLLSNHDIVNGHLSDHDQQSLGS